ncbi:right-handed parallel beta-helix repeat-containing protein [Alteromonas sp. 345S023]|uniref:Right-handed parallel beta-helix repeat-containing protein n=1 Tax=Alteromonas profundi TaxID=2696062 RepID=A0A7X5LM14_9ALTE|nr:right-handed parallel beta-helix repeat-containing protein [Alteromonas profundi]NDV91399.1 right-handed parallel beta-helix repeat-containing protein [Alteromonas profundi]
MDNLTHTIRVLMILLCGGISFFCEGSVTTYRVNSVPELKQAVNQVNRLSSALPVEIILADGVYENATNIRIMHPNTSLRSHSNDPLKVILVGTGMRKRASVEVIFDISASNVTVSGMTLKSVANHLIQVRAERDADFFTLTNCILQDSYQQLLKVSGGNQHFADFGIVKNNRFEYTAGVGPNYYIGGIDAHHSRGWTVTDNTFSNIASPAERVAEHAIHFWHNSGNVSIRDNTIINSDRGIGLGMGKNGDVVSENEVINNRIVHTNKKHLFADVGISLENVSDTLVVDNVIYMTTSYPNAIEYRFPRTQRNIIMNNVSNRAIVSRDNGEALLNNNKQAATGDRLWLQFEHFLNQF